VLGVSADNSFDAEIVDNKAKWDWSRDGASEAVGVPGDMVAVLDEVFAETLAVNSAGLGRRLYIPLLIPTMMRPWWSRAYMLCCVMICVMISSGMMWTGMRMYS
jgi:hypothetical protein